MRRRLILFFAFFVFFSFAVSGVALAADAESCTFHTQAIKTLKIWPVEQDILQTQEYTIFTKLADREKELSTEISLSPGQYACQGVGYLSSQKTEIGYFEVSADSKDFYLAPVYVKIDGSSVPNNVNQNILSPLKTQQQDLEPQSKEYKELQTKIDQINSWVSSYKVDGIFSVSYLNGSGTEREIEPKKLTDGNQAQGYIFLIVNGGKNKPVVLQLEFQPAKDMLYYEGTIIPPVSQTLVLDGVKKFENITGASNNNYTTKLEVAASMPLTFKIPSQYYSNNFHVYQKDRHYTPFFEFQPQLIDRISDPDNVSITYNLPAGSNYLHYTLDGTENSVKISRIMDVSVFNSGDTVPVVGYSTNLSDYSERKWASGDWSHYELPKEFKIPLGSEEANLYLNVDDSNYLTMTAQGSSFRLEAFRVWQAVNSVTNNYFIEPEFTYQVLGDSVKVNEQPEGSAEGREYVEIAPQQNGVSFIKVGYDAMVWDKYMYNEWPVKDVGSKKSEIIFFNGIEPVNTRVIVANVGAKNTANIQTNIEDPQKRVGSEYDTIYYAATINGKAAEDHADFTFTPTANSELAVRVREPIHNVNDIDTVWNQGWHEGVRNADGSFTVPLVDGRNIIEVKAANGSVVYHVINCRALNVNLKNTTRPDAQDYQIGDTLELTFEGLTLPVQKMSAIYNPNFPDNGWLEYDTSTGQTLRSDIGSQYNVIKPEIHKISISLTEPGDLVLSNGRIHNMHLGSGLDTHRNIPEEGLRANMGASSSTSREGAYFSVLPELTIHVEANEAQESSKFLYAQLNGWTLADGVTEHSANTVASGWDDLDSIRNVYQGNPYYNETQKNALSDNYALKLAAKLMEENVTVSARYKEDGTDKWINIELIQQDLESGKLLNISPKKSYMLELTVAPNDPDNGYTHTYTRHIITQQSDNQSIKNSKPLLKNLVFDAGISDKGVANMDGLLKAKTGDDLDLGYGFLATRNEFTVTLPVNTANLTIEPRPMQEYTVGGDLSVDGYIIEPEEGYAPTVAVTYDGADSNEKNVTITDGKYVIDLNNIYGISLDTNVQRMAVYSLAQDTDPQYAAQINAISADEAEIKGQNDSDYGIMTVAEANAGAKVTKIHIKLTSDPAMGKTENCKNNEYVINIVYVNDVELNVENQAENSTLRIFDQKGNLVTPIDGKYTLRSGETYKYYYEALGCMTQEGSFNVPEGAKEHNLSLPALSRADQTTGKANVTIFGPKSILREVQVEVDPKNAVDMVAGGYAKYNHGGYTVLDALIQAMQSNGGKDSSFSCTNGVFTPSVSNATNGHWVCEAVGSKVDSPFSTLLNANDDVYFYWQPNEANRHAWFDQTELKASQGEKVTLTLYAHEIGGGHNSGSPAANVNVYRDGELIGTTDERGRIVVDTASIDNYGTYFITAGGAEGYTFAQCALQVTKTTTGAATQSGVSISFWLIGSSADSTSVDFAEASGDPFEYFGIKYETWIPRQTYYFPGVTEVSVADVFERVLDEAGFSYEGLNNNYISEIITDTGVSLKEFDHGNRSGWMYTVNGVHPGFGLKEFSVSNGDQIVWHYVNDFLYEVKDWGNGFGEATRGDRNTWNKWLEADPKTPTISSGNASPAAPEDSTEIRSDTTIDRNGKANAYVQAKDIKSAIDKAKDADHESITVTPKIDGEADGLNVTVPNSSVKEMADNELGLNINSTKGGLSLSKNALAALSEGGKATSELQFVFADKAAKDLPEGVEAPSKADITEVQIKRDGEVVNNFGGNSITVQLPVESKNYKAGETYTVVLVNADGTTETMTGKCVNNNGNYFVEIVTKELGTFMVTPEKAQAPKTMPFTDVKPGDWYYDAVQYIYSAGLMGGESDTLFNPNGKLTRGMMAAILYRMEGAKAPAEPAAFNDVAAGKWYSDAVAWASYNGIVKGYDDGSFKPLQFVSREEMAAMLMRYAEWKHYDVSARADLSSFPDGAKVSAWAKTNVEWANASGLLKGNAKGEISPQGTATRAEAATLIMRFVEAHK